MALLDTEQNVIVLRVVYDGPPEAGKTTSLRALSASLGQELHTPAEQDGRTLYFDWMDYTGGRFEGYQIRCQILSVPGQLRYARRRHQLLRDADVIVCVADTGAAGIEGTVQHLRELPAILAGLPKPDVGVILQANKRDLADAVPMEDIRRYLEQADLRVGVVESVAAEGSGIREAFVFAVRLGLDRVRELLRTQELRSGRPEIDDAAGLLASMKAAEELPELAEAEDVVTIAKLETSAIPAAPPSLALLIEENELVASAHGSSELDTRGDEVRPAPPNPAVPSGSIWPPVDGRLILHEAASIGMSPASRLRNGAWVAGLGTGWRTYSNADAGCADLDEGRTLLIRWARLHAAFSELLSPRRCIVLADAHDGGWRLWQIVRAERSLADLLQDIDNGELERAETALLTVAAALVDMSIRLERATCILPCTLQTIGLRRSSPVYVGLMPQTELRMAPVVPSAKALASELDRLLHFVPPAGRDRLRLGIRNQVRLAIRANESAVLQSLHETSFA